MQVLLKKDLIFNYFDQFWPVFVSIANDFKMVNPSNEKTNVNQSTLFRSILLCTNVCTHKKQVKLHFLTG